MTSSRIKAAAALAALELLLLGALLALALSAKTYGGNRLLAVPHGFGAQGLNPERVEETWEGEFLITYEARQTKFARALNARHSVTVVGTNENYPAVMGQRMLSGGFFTGAARKAQSRHAVLNAAAAFTLFGSNDIAGNKFKLDDETWTVAGVMDDGIDDARVYAPATVLGLDVQSLLALMDGQRVTREYAANALKNLGIYEDQYDMIDLGSEAAGYWERFLIAAMAAFCAALLLLLRSLPRRAADNYRALKDALRHMYPRELFLREFSGMMKFLLILAALVLGAAAVLLLLTRILGSALTLAELSLGAQRLSVNDFAEKVSWLQEHFVPGNALLAAALLVSALAAIAGCASSSVHHQQAGK